MGQTNSSISMSKKFRRRSFKSPFSRRSSKLNLSATFTMSEDEQKVELLNINTATEEEFMTLPGITRAIAHDIIEHRKAIGRFKKVEDLALVKGIGADKLDSIRSEICVNRRKNISSNSSRAQSLDSLDSRLNKVVDVNQANVFELQGVHGLTQELAANIVDYRTTKGAFKQLDDLIKVKGIDNLHLSNIRTYLTVNSEQKRPVSEIYQNGITHDIINPTTTHQFGHRKSPSTPIKFSLCNGLSASSINDIFELLSAYSYRPIPEEEFNYERNGEQALRIASWNIQSLSIDKVQNLGVKEVVCRTILENRWSIIAVQEVLEIEALHLICEALNKPHLRRIAEWKNNSRQWSYCMSEVAGCQLGFIYDSYSGGIGVSLNSLGYTAVDDCQASLAEFLIKNLNISILNIYLPKNELNNVEAKLKQAISDESKPWFILGDFTSLSKKVTEDSTEIGGMRAILPLSINTNCLSIKSSQSRFSDNILTTKEGQLQLTGVWGVIRQGLSHLAIPWGWNWGGPASTHCPVWAEIYASPNTGTAL